jgi:hypothetical protein
MAVLDAPAVSPQFKRAFWRRGLDTVAGDSIVDGLGGFAFDHHVLFKLEELPQSRPVAGVRIPPSLPQDSYLHSVRCRVSTGLWFFPMVVGWPRVLRVGCATQEAREAMWISNIVQIDCRVCRSLSAYHVTDFADATTLGSCPWWQTDGRGSACVSASGLATPGG